MRNSFDLDDILNEVNEWEAEPAAEAERPAPADHAVPGRQPEEPGTGPVVPEPAYTAPEEEEQEEYSGESSQDYPEDYPEESLEEEEAPENEPEDEPEYEPETTRPAPRRKKKHRIRDAFLSVIFGALSILCLAWGLAYLHPTGNAVKREAIAVASAEGAPADSMPEAEPVPADMQLEVPADMSNVPEDMQEVPGEMGVPGDMSVPEDMQAEMPADGSMPEPEPTPEPTPEVPAKPHYVIDEHATTAPAPIEASYGTISIDNAAEVMNIIQQARDSGLLGEDEVVAFNPNANFYRGLNWRDIEYYLDDTIMVILWKENIEGKCCTFTEVKVADASQFRRKLADDTFGSQAQYYASTLSMSANAVVAMNADYYLFRDFGISVYDRALYRFNTDTYTGQYKKYNCVDTLFIDGKGDFLYKRLLEENSAESMAQFIQDNDIRFSIAFGPVLVENGQPLVCDWYPVGEINRLYSRAGIGQMGELHYLYMSLNHGSEEARWTVNQFAEHFAEKPVITAYCLDGGQTGEVVFRGEPYNYIDFGAERTVSDIVYFATAIPEGER